MKDIDQPELAEEERDRLVRVFELLISMDKKQNPETYSRSSDHKDTPRVWFSDVCDVSRTFTASPH